MIHFFQNNTQDNSPNTAKLFVAETFSVYDLKKPLSDYLKSTSVDEIDYAETSNGFTATYTIASDEKKQEITKMALQFSQNETIVTIVGTTITVNLETFTETKTPVTATLEKQPFFTALQTYLLQVQNDDLYALDNAEGVYYTTSTDAFMKNFIFHQLLPKEYVLAVLDVTDVKVSETPENFPKSASWYFVVTSKESYILGKEGNANFIKIQIVPDDFHIRKRRGKDLITAGNVQFYTEFLNDTLFHDLLSVVTATTTKLAAFADVLVKKYNKKEMHLALAARMYMLQNSEDNVLLNEIKSKIIVHFQKLKIDTKNVDIINALLTEYGKNHETFGDHLVMIAKDWQLLYDTQRKLLNMLQPLQKPETAANTLAYHTYFREKFEKKRKKPETKFEFDLNYVKHVTNAQQFEEALHLYQNLYESLPDDSIAELLPAETTNLLEGEGGQQLEITLLEAIATIQRKLERETTETSQQLAVLQPLVSARLQTLINQKTHAEKAETIQDILLSKEIGVFPEKEHTVKDYQRLEKDVVWQSVVPQCFKDATGFFNSLNTFIAAIKTPDYKSVISFSDRIDYENYPEILQRITAICYALQIDVPECYIGRGSYSNSVIGVEGKPPYLLIGIDFLDSESIRYLNNNSLTFLVGVELAHMYFEHTKITSTDVWRGAAEKGFSVVSMLLSVLPFVGNIGRMFGNIASVQKYGKIINRVEQVASIAERGQGIMEVGEKFNVNFLHKATAKSTDKQNLLITSRLMEIIADKVAFLFCEDLPAAIYAMLASASTFEQDKAVIAQYGFESFLARTDAKGTFVHQELIIRLHHLCSFYLSDTYENLQDVLHKTHS